MRFFFLPILLIIGGGLASNIKTGNSLKKSQKKAASRGVTSACASSSILATPVPNADSMIAEANSAFTDWQNMHVSKKSFKNKQEKLDVLATTCLDNAKAASLLANGCGVIARRHIELITGLWGFGDVAKESLKDCALNCPELLGCKVLFAKKVLAFEILLTDGELSPFPATQDRTREERFIVTLFNAIVLDQSITATSSTATPEQIHFRDFITSLKTILLRRKNDRLKQEEKEKEEQERLQKKKSFIEQQNALQLEQEQQEQQELQQQQLQQQQEKEDLEIKSSGTKKKSESPENVVENVQVVVEMEEEEKKKSPQSVSSIKSDVIVDVVDDVITESRNEVEAEAAEVDKVDKRKDGELKKVVSIRKRRSKAAVKKVKEGDISEEFVMIDGEEGGHGEEEDCEGISKVGSTEDQGVATTSPPPTAESSCIIC